MMDEWEKSAHSQNQRVQLAKLSLKEKVTYLDIGLRMEGIQCDKKVVEKIIKIYDLILLKGGNVNIKDMLNAGSENNSE